MPIPSSMTTRTFKKALRQLLIVTVLPPLSLPLELRFQAEEFHTLGAHSVADALHLLEGEGASVGLVLLYGNIPARTSDAGMLLDTIERMRGTEVLYVGPSIAQITHDLRTEGNHCAYRTPPEDIIARAKELHGKARQRVVSRP